MPQRAFRDWPSFRGLSLRSRRVLKVAFSTPFLL